MNTLNFNIEWEDPQGAKGPELRATWASLSITVGDQIVTDVFNRHLRAVQDRLYLPLYPIAEWIAQHWWHLTKEPLVPGRSTRQDYSRRHSLLASAEGFAVPSLTIQPQGGAALLTWEAFRFANSPLRFLSSGQTFVDISQLEGELRALVDSVVERLESHGIEGTYLQKEWLAICSLDAEETAFCASAGLLGLDPFNLSEETIAKIEGVEGSLPKELLEDFFGSADPFCLEQGAAEVVNGIDGAQTTTVSDVLAAVRNQLSGIERASLPWVAGYEVANLLRNQIAVTMPYSPDASFLAGLLGLTWVPPEIGTPRRPNWFEALVQVSELRTGKFFLTRTHDRAARFILCRLAYEYLTASENNWRLVSQSRTDSQARNRAFAAEFLVPAALLAQKLPSSILDQEEVQDLADEFGVSSWIVRHQLENHGLAQIVD